MERTERGRRAGGNGKARGQERKQGGWGKDEGRLEAGRVGKGRRDRGRGRPSLCPGGLSSLPASIIKALQPPSTLPGSLPASRSASRPFHRSRCFPPRPAARAPRPRPRQPIWGPDGPPPEPNSWPSSTAFQPAWMLQARWARRERLQRAVGRLVPASWAWERRGYREEAPVATLGAGPELGEAANPADAPAGDRAQELASPQLTLRLLLFVSSSISAVGD